MYKFKQFSEKTPELYNQKRAGAFSESRACCTGRFTPSPSLKDEQGFVFVHFLFLLPILCVLFFFLFRQSHFILLEQETRNVCRSELLKAQTKTATSIERLLQLNPLIRTAKTTKAGAIAAMAVATAAANPVAFAAAQRVYAAAENSLKALSASQKALIAKASADMNIGLWTARREVRKAWEKRSGSTFKTAGLFTNFSRPNVAVRPMNASDPYPEYELESPFPDRQALQVSWKIEIQNKERRWKQTKWNIQRTCGATLIQDSGRLSNHLRSKLTADKFWSNSSSFFF